MRTKLHIYDSQHHRDSSWITDEAIEEYAASELRGPIAALHCVEKWAQLDPLKINQFNELIVGHPTLAIIKDELLDEYGEEAFIGKPRSLQFHIRQIELRMEMCRDPSEYAKLAKQLADMQGWNVKPTERAAPIGLNVTVNTGTPQLDASNPREAQRIVMSVLANACAV